MADYYPLISRAIGALDENNGENRRALYERARTALLAQLRGVTPALDESDITRERLALEESIRKVEAESARQFLDGSRRSAQSRRRAFQPFYEPKPDPLADLARLLSEHYPFGEFGSRTADPIVETRRRTAEAWRN
jgi:hypothetical protein